MNKIILKCADDKSLEFEHLIQTNKFICYVNEEQGEYYEFHRTLPFQIDHHIDGKEFLATESINIQSIHIIEEKECPKCKGNIEMIESNGDKKSIYNCQNCKETGKISVETSFTVFGKSQEEYNAEKYEKGIEEGLNEGADKAMSDISIIINGDTLMDN